MIFPGSGLYAITQTDGKSNEQVIEAVHSALKGGASVIQYRDKVPSDALYLAKELLVLCRHHQTPLIINDDADFALQIGADGVHIGKDDVGIAAARKVLGSKAIIGLSCYDNIDTALQAQANGVNYVAFGRFFPSSSKPLAAPAQIETLQQARKQINIPIVAIGGILPENGRQLLNAGADILAVIGGVFDHAPEQSSQAYLKLFNS
ncbi:MAG: thiamine phosphate synthase [Methylococcales bacterium]|nr:thiamine phosphate synthase [Methylococcales bacterium]